MKATVCYTPDGGLRCVEHHSEISAGKRQYRPCIDAGRALDRLLTAILTHPGGCHYATIFDSQLLSDIRTLPERINQHKANHPADDFPVAPTVSSASFYSFPIKSIDLLIKK